MKPSWSGAKQRMSAILCACSFADKLERATRRSPRIETLQEVKPIRNVRKGVGRRWDSSLDVVVEFFGWGGGWNAQDVVLLVCPAWRVIFDPELNILIAVLVRLATLGAPELPGITDRSCDSHIDSRAEILDVDWGITCPAAHDPVDVAESHDNC
jgi:hypothetical protein